MATAARRSPLVTITINGVNDAPTAGDQAVSTDEDTAVPVTLTGSDPEGDTLTFIIVTPPAHGTLSGTGANLTYTPDANYNGPDSFQFKVNDGATDSNTATVSITVNSINDAPVANNGSGSTAEDTPLVGALTGSDADGDTLSFFEDTGPAHGLLILNTDGTFTYTPDLDYNGPDSFTFVANDGTVDSAGHVLNHRYRGE